jgi:hypothetical protein
LKRGEGLLLVLGHRRKKRLEIDDDRWGPRSVTGREKEGYRFGSGASWAGWFPGSAQLGLWPLPFIFFFCFPFFFLFYFLFCVLNELSHSKLNKFKADHLWSFKSVFRS